MPIDENPHKRNKNHDEEVEVQLDLKIEDGNGEDLEIVKLAEYIVSPFEDDLGNLKHKKLNHHFDFVPANLPNLFGSLEGVNAETVEKLIKLNERRIHYMKFREKQMDEFEKLIIQQKLLHDELNKIKIESFKTRQDLEHFVREHRKKVEEFEINIHKVANVVRHNRDKYEKLKKINDAIEHDKHLKEEIAEIDADGRIYETVLNILTGKVDGE
jgi:hypothetical protein